MTKINPKVEEKKSQNVKQIRWKHYTIYHYLIITDSDHEVMEDVENMASIINYRLRSTSLAWLLRYQVLSFSLYWLTAFGEFALDFGELPLALISQQMWEFILHSCLPQTHPLLNFQICIYLFFQFFILVFSPFCRFS